MGRNLTAEEVEKEYFDAMGPDLGPFYRLLNIECQALHVEWAEFKVLFGTNPERIELMNRAAHSFFFRLQNTLWERTLLHIARLMDPPNSGINKENLTLRRLPDLVDPAIRCKIDHLLQVAQEKCAFSFDWRSRRIAHRDLNLTLKTNAKRLEAASRLSVEAALEAIVEVLNVVESHYCNGSNVAYDWVIYPPGAKALLYLLREGLEARAARRRRLASGQPLPEDMERRRPL